jgi:hypothetical protein
MAAALAFLQQAQAALANDAAVLAVRQEEQAEVCADVMVVASITQHLKHGEDRRP